jgi:NADH-quinone oxidoreductase subunit J
MTTRPRLKLGAHLARGVAAVLLFGVLAAVTLGADFGPAAGFPEVESITAIIGFAMFDIPADAVAETGTESFLVAFVVIAFVLDAALEGAVMLARRDEDGAIVSALERGGDD